MGAADCASVDAECREENVIHEEDDRERLNGSNGLIPKDNQETNEETMEVIAKVFSTPEYLLPPERTESLVYLHPSRRGSLVDKYKSV